MCKTNELDSSKWPITNKPAVRKGQRWLWNSPVNYRTEYTVASDVDDTGRVMLEWTTIDGRIESVPWFADRIADNATLVYDPPADDTLPAASGEAGEPEADAAPTAAQLLELRALRGLYNVLNGAVKVTNAVIDQYTQRTGPLTPDEYNALMTATRDQVEYVNQLAELDLRAVDLAREVGLKL